MTDAILALNASSRSDDSLSRQLVSYAVNKLNPTNDASIINRDLANSELPLITEAHISAYYTSPANRTEEQKALLKVSDAYIAELKSTKKLVIGAPIYNFSVPAALKAWIDLVCRVGETFVYEENGPRGLTEIETAYIIVTAGGVPIGSPADFNSRYLQQVCRFIGVKESHIIDVSGSKRDPETLIDYGKQQIDALISSK